MENGIRLGTMFRRGALMLVLFAGLGYLAIQLVPGASDRLASASAGWIAVCIVVELVACAGFAACFTACFSYPPHPVPRERTSEIALGELAAFAVVPTGLAAPLLRFWALGRGGMPIREIGVRSVVHAVLLNVPYLGAALVLGAWAVSDAGSGDASAAVALAPFAIVAAAFVIAGLLLLAGRRGRRIEPTTRSRRFMRELATILPDGLRAIPDRARRPAAMGGAAVYWACDCAVLWLAFQAIDAPQSVWIVALAYMLGQLGTWLPLPGGVGGVEPLMAGVLHTSGVNLGASAAAIVIYRAVSLGLQAAVGAAAVGLLVPAVRAEAATRSGRQGS
jgi:uncharacterized membrane protein YbhN (UPF0104 family)